MASRWFDNLETGRAETWLILQQAARDRQAPLRNLVVAGRGDDGPQARTMVLRDAGADRAEIGFFTDIRSAKVAALRKDPRVVVIGYDPKLRLQLRMAGQIRIETTGPSVDRAWQHQVPAYAHTDYLTHAAPGTIIADPSMAWGLPVDVLVARGNFAVMTVALDWFEWLLIAADGHRRAHYLRGDTGWRANWLTP